MRSRTSSMLRYLINHCTSNVAKVEKVTKFTYNILLFLCYVVHADTQTPPDLGPGFGFFPAAYRKYIPKSNCPANMYGLDCYPCEVSNFPVDSNCIPCPAYSTSPAGSVYISHCKCQEGYYETYDTRSITTFGNLPSDMVVTTLITTMRCQAVGGVTCPSNFYYHPTIGGFCIPCPQDSTGKIGIQNVTGCECKAGYKTVPKNDFYWNSDKIDYFDCIQCQEYQYAPYRGSTCMSCPVTTRSLKSTGSVLTDCQCVPGYTGRNGNASNCIKCEAGKYSLLGGLDPCLPCPGNSTDMESRQGCMCKQGFFGYWKDNCQACPAGKYQYSFASQDCYSCPENTTSPVASTSLLNCVCHAGSTGTWTIDEFQTYNLKCVTCLAGKYKSIIGNTPCLDCPANTRSLSASTTLTACICNAGFSRVADTCLACKAGTYKTVSGDGPCTNCTTEEPSMDSTRQIQRAQICQQCLPGTYQNTLSQDASCVNCPANTSSAGGSKSLNDCTCKDGFIGKLNACKECPTGTYANSNPPCIDKPGIVITYEWDKTDWMCSVPDTQWRNREGYTTSFFSLAPWACNQVCNECCATCRNISCGGACKSGTYCKNVTLDSVCSTCPANSSPALTTCICNAGFAVFNGESCNACDAGKFSIGAQMACTACEVGKYSDTGMTSCINCPSNSYSSIVGSTINGCECNAGFSGVGGMCSSCTAGKYKDSRGSACSSCPVNTTSPSRSLALSDCVCSAGYTCLQKGSFETNNYDCKYFNDNPTQCGLFAACDKCCECIQFCKDQYNIVNPFGCTSCPVGQNKTSIGPAPCLSCPSGQTSTDGVTCEYAFVADVTCSCVGRTLASRKICQSSTGTKSGIITVNQSQYENSLYCSWIIASNGFISLVFSSFDTDNGYDFVKINRCSTFSCSTVEKVVELTGSGDIRTVFTSSTGYMQVIFQTDNIDTYSGFAATWTLTPLITTSTTQVRTTSTTQVRTTSTTLVMTTTTTPVPKTSTTPAPIMNITQGTTANNTLVPTINITQRNTTNNTLSPTINITQNTTNNTLSPTINMTQAIAISSTPMPTRNITQGTTISSTPIPTKNITQGITTSSTPTPTTSTPTVITTKSDNTTSTTPARARGTSVYTSSTTPVPNEISTPIPSSSSDILGIIAIVTTILILVCCCLVCILCYYSRDKTASELENGNSK